MTRDGKAGPGTHAIAPRTGERQRKAERRPCRRVVAIAIHQALNQACTKVVVHLHGSEAPNHGEPASEGQLALAAIICLYIMLVRSLTEPLSVR